FHRDRGPVDDRVLGGFPLAQRQARDGVSFDLRSGLREQIGWGQRARLATLMRFESERQDFGALVDVDRLVGLELQNPLAEAGLLEPLSRIVVVRVRVVGFGSLAKLFDLDHLVSPSVSVDYSKIAVRPHGQTWEIR